jgi:hypothetical protein
MHISLKPRHARGFLYSLCIGEHRTERKLLRWSVGHLRLPTNPAQMTSPGPSRLTPAGRGAYAIRALRHLCLGIVSGV